MSHIPLIKISDLTEELEKHRQQETLLIDAYNALNASHVTLQARYDASLAAIAALESKITGEIKALDLELKNVYSKLTAANETIVTLQNFVQKVSELPQLPIVTEARDLLLERVAQQLLGEYNAK